MPAVTKKQPTKKSSRVSKRDSPKPPPLRFATVKAARAHMKANSLKMVEYQTHARGVRIQVVDDKGKPRTISIERPKKKETSNGT